MSSPCRSASLLKVLVSFSKPQRQSYCSAPSYLAVRSGTARSISNLLDSGEVSRSVPDQP